MLLHQNPKVVLLLAVGLAFLSTCPSFSQEAQKPTIQKQKLRAQTLAYMPPGYKEQALKLIIEEANQVAKELNLQEPLPITASNLVSSYISPPRISQFRQGLGNITTSNYVYYISVGYKFSFLEKRNWERELGRAQTDYIWPISRMDTNAAYDLATKSLKAISVDVKALDRDCIAHIVALTPETMDKEHFVPLYSVWWERKNAQGQGCVAELEVLLPTQNVLQIHVFKSEYIIRKPLVVANLKELLAQTNSGQSDFGGSNYSNSLR